MEEPKKYILFCAQEANFQTRSMLIPYDLIMKCEPRKHDLEILRDNSKKNISFEHLGQVYIVDQLLIQNITWEGNIGYHDVTPYSRIINEFIAYADGTIGENGSFFEPYDQEWVEEIIPHIASIGFNHIINYCNFRDQKEVILQSSSTGKAIEIVEGFLVLESDNGKLRTLYNFHEK